METMDDAMGEWERRQAEAEQRQARIDRQMAAIEKLLRKATRLMYKLEQRQRQNDEPPPAPVQQ